MPNSQNTKKYPARKWPSKKKDVAKAGDVVELFAGVGGFRLGLEASGWNVILSNQWEPATRAQHASSVYVKKFGEDGHLTADIEKVLDAAGIDSFHGSTDVDPEVVEKSGSIEDLLTGKAKKFAIPAEVDVVVGGFPCQDYSVAKTLSSSLGLEGKKGVLWWQIMRLIKSQRPKMVFLENVDRLLKSPASQRGRDFAIMLASLSDAGYFVEWRVVNAAEYGFPQRRKRVFIVAKNNKFFTPPLEDDLSFLTKDGVMARALPVRDILTDNVQSVTLVGGLDELTQTFGVGDKSSKFLTAGYMVGRSVTTSKVEAFPEKHLGKRKFQRWHLEHVLQEDVDNEFQIPRSDWGKWQGAKNGGNSGRTHSSGFKYTYSEGRMSFPDEINRPARTILTAEGGSSPSRFKHAVDDLVGVRRRLTPVELELLNDFPVDWTKEGLDGQMTNVRRAFFMGNALIVGVVERIGLVLAEDWRELSPKA